MNKGPEWGAKQWVKIVDLPASSVYIASSELKTERENLQ